MIVYVDKDHKCHTKSAEGLNPVETEFFNGKCDTFIEGYCYEVNGNVTSIYPWKPYDELDNAQREYERQLLAEYESALAEIESALGV